jgi:hypothetical protein
MPNRRAIVRYQRKPESSRGTAKQRERVIQQALTRWLRQEYPHIDFFNDWASGAYLTAGQNNARLDISSRNGWVDLFIPEPSRGYHGLFIELKKEGIRPYLRNGNVSANPQIKKEHEFLLRQHNKGYCARFACGLEKAKELIDWYFQRERPENLEMF